MFIGFTIYWLLGSDEGLQKNMKLLCGSEVKVGCQYGIVNVMERLLETKRETGGSHGYIIMCRRFGFGVNLLASGSRERREKKMEAFSFLKNVGAATRDIPTNNPEDETSHPPNNTVSRYGLFGGGVA